MVDVFTNEAVSFNHGVACEYRRGLIVCHHGLRLKDEAAGTLALNEAEDLALGMTTEHRQSSYLDSRRLFKYFNHYHEIFRSVAAVIVRPLPLSDLDVVPAHRKG